jgi:hypothetical protein
MLGDHLAIEREDHGLGAGGADIDAEHVRCGRGHVNFP